MASELDRGSKKAKLEMNRNKTRENGGGIKIGEEVVEKVEAYVYLG